MSDFTQKTNEQSLILRTSAQLENQLTAASQTIFGEQFTTFREVLDFIRAQPEDQRLQLTVKLKDTMLEFFQDFSQGFQLLSDFVENSKIWPQEKLKNKDFLDEFIIVKKIAKEYKSSTEKADEAKMRVADRAPNAPGIEFVDAVVVPLCGNKTATFNAIVKARKTYLSRDTRDILLNGCKRLVKRLRGHTKYNGGQLQPTGTDIRDGNKEDHDVAGVTASDVASIDKNLLLDERGLVWSTAVPADVGRIWKPDSAIKGERLQEVSVTPSEKEKVGPIETSAKTSIGKLKRKRSPPSSSSSPNLNSSSIQKRAPPSSENLSVRESKSQPLSTSSKPTPAAAPSEKEKIRPVETPKQTSIAKSKRERSPPSSPPSQNLDSSSTQKRVSPPPPESSSIRESTSQPPLIPSTPTPAATGPTPPLPDEKVSHASAVSKRREPQLPLSKLNSADTIIWNMITANAGSKTGSSSINTHRKALSNLSPAAFRKSVSNFATVKEKLENESAAAWVKGAQECLTVYEHLRVKDVRALTECQRLIRRHWGDSGSNAPQMLTVELTKGRPESIAIWPLGAHSLAGARDGWLTDDVILATMKLDAEKTSGVWVVDPVVWANWERRRYSAEALPRLPKPQPTKMLVPCHFENHWALLFFDFDASTVKFIDSIQHDKRFNKAVESATAYLQQHKMRRNNWSIDIFDSESQENQSDCGVFVIENARLLVESGQVSPPVNSGTRLGILKRLVSRIEKGKLKDERKLKDEGKPKDEA